MGLFSHLKKRMQLGINYINFNLQFSVLNKTYNLTL